VLVSQVGEIVDTLDVVPDESIWKLDVGEWLSLVTWLWLGGDLSAWGLWVHKLFLS
jgi:hypothetical protein